MLGTFYYKAPNIDPTQQYSMQGVIEVVPFEPKLMKLETFWNDFQGMTGTIIFLY